MMLMRRAAAVVSRIRPVRRHATPMPPAPTTAIHEGYPPAGPAAVPFAGRFGSPAPLACAVGSPFPDMGYPGAAAPSAGVPPEVRRMMAANLRHTLAYVPDPEQRQMMIDQYRAVGVDLDADPAGT